MMYTDYLTSLSDELNELHIGDRKEIIKYYKDCAKEDGLLTADDMMKEFGAVKELAKAILKEMEVSRDEYIYTNRGLLISLKEVLLMKPDIHNNQSSLFITKALIVLRVVLSVLVNIIGFSLSIFSFLQGVVTAGFFLPLIPNTPQIALSGVGVSLVFLGVGIVFFIVVAGLSQSLLKRLQVDIDGIVKGRQENELA